MYDEPPDPQPNPCPFCEDELGYGENCDHCKLAAKLSDTENSLSKLRHQLHCRARNLAWLPPGPEVAARRAEGIALLLDMAGLKMPAEYLAQAKAAMVGEYGEHVRWASPKAAAIAGPRIRPLPARGPAVDAPDLTEGVAIDIAGLYR